MRIGFALPHFGDLASPEAIKTVAQHVEKIGGDSLWTGERLLVPTAPKVGYPGTPDGSFPASMYRSVRPLQALTFAAAHTERVNLGTSIINMHLNPPLLLAQDVTSLDVLSGGRARLGLGNGWMPEEFSSLGVPMKQIGKRADEYLQTMKAIWTQDKVSFAGDFVTIPESTIGLKPVRDPHPPIYLAAYSEGAMRRVAQHADGWNPAGVPGPALSGMMAGIKQMAGSFGRDPERLEMIVRANLNFTAKPLPTEGRPSFYGDAAQQREDIAAIREAGAHELFFDLNFMDDMTLPRLLSSIDELYQLATS